MNNIIEQMLSKYDVKNTTDEINVLKEKITTIVWSVIITIVLIVFMFWAILFVFEF